MTDNTTAHSLSVPTIGSHVPVDKPNTIDLYSATYSDQNHTIGMHSKPVPFIHPITLTSPDGTTSRVDALFDDSAMAGAMSTSTFNTIKHGLFGWQQSSRALHMANGVIVPSEATWTGTIHVEGVEATGTFEVFDSGGGWSFLFGKPLLQAFKAKHDYETDEVTITNGKTTSTLCNCFLGNQTHPTADTTHSTAIQSVPSMEKQVEIDGNKRTSTKEIPQKNTDSIFTRRMDPFAKLRVEYIIQNVKVGNDLTAREKEEVVELLTEYADVFACALSKVLLIPGAQVELNILEDTTFRTSVHQRPMNPPQRKFMHKWVDQMIEGDLIKSADIPRIKHVAPTVLTQKIHDGNGGMTLDDLQYELNRQCAEANLPQPFQQHTSATKEQQPTKPPNEAPKWRVTQNFAELNKVTRIPPMFQGDIRAKQQRLSGHRYVSVFNFASGFYAIEIPERWRPYFTFFVDGKGYLWYKRMAMGWTGAPTVFSAAVTNCLHDILADDTMELFVDDGGCKDNTFAGMIAKLRQIFQRCRKHKLSLSLTKCRLFMTETTFAGATVGPHGVQPDLAKLSPIVSWKQPDNALNLTSFLGLMGHFRDLIKGYSKIEGPLRDLLKQVDIPKPISKSTY